MTAHTCHAHECRRVVPPAMFMCRAHWYSLDARVRTAIWREYRPGQEIDKDPSNRYLAVQQYAIASLLFKPDDEQAAIDMVPYLTRFVLHREAAINNGDGDPLPWVVR